MPQCKSREDGTVCRNPVTARNLTTKTLSFVIPAQAGTQGKTRSSTSLSWAPAFAGVTEVEIEQRES